MLPLKVRYWLEIDFFLNFYVNVSHWTETWLSADAFLATNHWPLPVPGKIIAPGFPWPWVFGACFLNRSIFLHLISAKVSDSSLSQCTPRSLSQMASHWYLWLSATSLLTSTWGFLCDITCGVIRKRRGIPWLLFMGTTSQLPPHTPSHCHTLSQASSDPSFLKTWNHWESPVCDNARKPRNTVGIWKWFWVWKWKLFSHVQLCDPMDHTVHGILQAGILEWAAFPFSRGSSQPRGQTQVSRTAGEFFTSWATIWPLKLLDWSV